MACARRSLTSNFTLLTRHFHPSLSHLLPHERDTDGDHRSNSRPLHDLDGCGSAVAGTWIRERSSLGFSLPFGLEPSLRRYSSSSGGSNDVEFIKDMTDAITEKGADVAEVLTERSVDVVQTASPSVSEVVAAAADSAPPVAALQHLIDAIHSFTGLNWWVSIALTTVLIRSCAVPLMIHQVKAASRLSVIRPELEEIKEQIQNATDPQVMQETQKRAKELFKKHGVTPFTPLKGMLIQGPVFISFYLAISNMVEKVPSFKEGGTLWFTDLTTPDPLYVLPVLTALSFLVTVELNVQEGMEGNPIAGNMKKFSRVLALLTVPFTASFPKAIFCYWITSNFFSLAYGRVLKRPPVRKFLNLPEVAPQSPVSQPSLPFFGGSKQSAPAALSSPSTAQQSQSPDRRKPSSFVINQRIRNLEKKVKGRSKPKKR